MKNFVVLMFVLFSLSAVSKAQRVTEEDIIPSEKNPALAFVCSLIIPGLGQMYNEEVDKGFLLLGGAFGGILVTSVTATSANYSENSVPIPAVGLLIYAFCSLYSIIDAPITANQITKTSRLRNAFRAKKLSSITYTTENDISVDLSPYLHQSSVGIQLNVSF